MSGDIQIIFYDINCINKPSCWKSHMAGHISLGLQYRSNLFLGLWWWYSMAWKYWLQYKKHTSLIDLSSRSVQLVSYNLQYQNIWITQEYTELNYPLKWDRCLQWWYLWNNHWKSHVLVNWLKMKLTCSLFWLDFLPQVKLWLRPFGPRRAPLTRIAFLIGLK